MSDTMAPCVYRVYDATGRLLYIGSAKDLEQRMKNHRSLSCWHPLAEHVTAESYPDMASARAAEAAAIRAEQPVFNLAHTGRYPARWLVTPEDVRVCREWMKAEVCRPGYLPRSMRWIAGELLRPPTLTAA